MKGGRAGAEQRFSPPPSLRLTILDFGLFQVHENGRIIGIPGYLIETPTGENILVDTGFPPWYENDRARAVKDDKLHEFGEILELTSEQFPAPQLAKVGLAPEAITHLVVTHGDIDHVGRIDEFVHAQIFIGDAELGMERPRYFGDVQRMAWPDDASYTRIDQDTEIFPGVTLLLTPGHTPGHLSLLLRLAHTGPVVVTGDAINRVQELEEDRYSGAWDEALVRQSAKKLLDITKDEGAFLIYGHDPAQWKTLKKAPEYYD